MLLYQLLLLLLLLLLSREKLLSLDQLLEHGHIDLS